MIVRKSVQLRHHSPAGRPRLRRRLNAVTCLLISCLSGSPAGGATQDIVVCDGYPCVNFAFGANVSRDGEVFSSSFYNPPRLGAGLEPLGGVHLKIRVDDREEVASGGCVSRKVIRQWPISRVQLQDPRLAGVSVEARLLCPSAIDNVFVGSLPVAMAELTLTNDTSSVRDCVVTLDAADYLPEECQKIDSEGISGLTDNHRVVAWARTGDIGRQGRSLFMRISLRAGESLELRGILGRWDENYPCSARLNGVRALVDHVARHWQSLMEGTARLQERLPRTGDEQLDDYFRWYMTAGVAMTRTLKDGTTLTMGYHELNQRDSFWTTWAHLVLWPAAEKRMIRESVWGQRPDGKVPTTILPVIEREHDIDINCYFILRALRYVRYHEDLEFGRQVLPSLTRAARWLAARDSDRDGLPEQQSYWYDWKDVPGMQGRKYSPHASMLYIAAMDRLAHFCRQVDDVELADEFRALAQRGRQLLNRDVSAGGLFNGRCYQHVWYEPDERSASLPQDQVVGILLDVVDDKTAASMLEVLQHSLCEWGVRESYPFFPEGFGYDAGDYHNGGIWPWVNHIHAWALLKTGRQAAAYDILRRVGHADLEMAGDFIPHEYLHGRTGRQAGVPMQGWNAAIFGTLFFGVHHAGQPVP